MLCASKTRVFLIELMVLQKSFSGKSLRILGEFRRLTLILHLFELNILEKAFFSEIEIDYGTNFFSIFNYI